MLPKCLKCSRKIPLSWINFSSYRTKYRCIKCGTLHKWNSRRQVTSIVVALSVAVNINLLNYYFQFYWINLSLSLIVAMFISTLIPSQYSLAKDRDEINRPIVGNTNCEK